ncbi:MAG: aminotransferase class V-fold PLP-dependent enzyme [Dermatophilaceae bacterium]
MDPTWWGDPHALHSPSRRARAALDDARERLAAGLGVRADELSFTPGGAAALRLGMSGLGYAGRRRGQGVVTSAVERAVVLQPARYAASYAGDPQRHRVVAVDSVGRIDLEQWGEAVASPETAYAVLQTANGEVGTRQPVAGAWAAAERHGIPLLVDATASLGRDPLPAHYDALAGEARSWGGPPGVGVLVVPSRTRFRREGPPSGIEGGRADDEPVIPLVLAAAAAWDGVAQAQPDDSADARRLVDDLRRAAGAVPETDVAGDPDDRLPHVLTFSALLADGEELVRQFDRLGFQVGSGSACTSSTLEPSHVLAAMAALTHGNIRITLPLKAVTPERERAVTAFCEALPAVVASVRAQLDGGALT